MTLRITKLDDRREWRTSLPWKMGFLEVWVLYMLSMMANTFFDFRGIKLGYVGRLGFGPGINAASFYVLFLGFQGHVSASILGWVLGKVCRCAWKRGSSVLKQGKNLVFVSLSNNGKLTI